MLNVAGLSRTEAMATPANIRMQYAMESAINVALWQINHDVDSLTRSTSEGVVCTWDGSLQTLNVHVSKFGRESEVLLDLSSDTHFQRGIAAQEAVILDGYDPGLNLAHQIRGQFEFLPQVDLQYFLDNAAVIHDETGKTWKNNTFPSGIHVFTGNYITVNSTRLLGGTMVFTGHHVTVAGDITIVSPPADTSGAQAALIFTDPLQSLELYSPGDGATIIGAIYCQSTVTLMNGHVSGPVIGQNVILGSNFDFLDEEYTENFQWTHGFGRRENYDWPKQIGRWHVESWNKSVVNEPDGG